MAQANPPRVRVVEDGPKVELNVSTENIGQVVLLARAFDEKVPPVEDNPGSSPGDGGDRVPQR